MASFTANANHAVNMDTIGDLSALVAGTTSWTTESASFTAANAALKVEIDAAGNFITAGGIPGNVKPIAGDVETLAVFHAGAFAYSIAWDEITRLPSGPDFVQLQTHIIGGGPQAGLAYLLRENDTVNGSNHGDVLHGFAGRDTIIGKGGADRIFGDDYHDKLFGGAGNDKLFGGDGNDGLTGGSGKDILDGGAGVDIADYSEKTAPVRVALHGATAATVFVGGVAEDTIKNIEDVVGGRGADHLTGDGSDNTLIGGDGNDILKGLGGKDTLTGGAGKDVLTGGPGKDNFYFDVAPAAGNADTITDFVHNADSILLAHGIFANISQADALAHNFFAVGAAHGIHDRIVYQPDTGALLYDADANGSGQGVVFAHVALHLPLDGFDFFVVS